MKKVLTIAGSDSSGGAGIQADIKTIMANGAYGMSALTALTAQNTVGVADIAEVSGVFLKKQLDAVFEDIYPDAVKIGMIPSKELIETVTERLKHYKAENIVVDPVMVTTSGDRLIDEEAVDSFYGLFCIASVVTPNICEAEVLSGMKISSKEDMVLAAKRLGDFYGCGILLKGGHSILDADDFLYYKDAGEWLCGKRINNNNTHGTGCTLSAAIATNLAKGFEMKTAVRRAKDYISGALSDMLDLGKGSGPLNHGFDLSGKFFI